MAPPVRRRLRGKTTPMVSVEGESSASEGEAEARPTARAMCGQFVWPCPRQFPPDVATRRARKWLLPEDLSKAEVGTLFKDVATRLGQGPNLAKVHVFDEPHKRFNPATTARARHKHIVFKMKAPFAHVRLQRALAERGIYGHFSFNLIGYVAYLQYCMVPSAKKLHADLDFNPWSWPHVSPAALLQLCSQPSPQMEARNGAVGARGRKRKLMTFSEVTDAFVEGGVKTEKDAWVLAKGRKVAGDDTLYNTLGGAQCVRSLVARVRQAWGCETMPSGTLHIKPCFGLDKFLSLKIIDASLDGWVAGGWKSRTLILSGRGGLGKTELGCALAHAAAPAKSFHFVNKVDRIRDVQFAPGEALVVDEVCLSGRDIDDAKALVDVERGRDVLCRNRDGFIPCDTPRVLSTNWPWEAFWPHDAQLQDHRAAIARRVQWVRVTRDVRVGKDTGAALPEVARGCDAELAEEDFGELAEEDVFDLGLCAA